MKKILVWFLMIFSVYVKIYAQSGPGQPEFMQFQQAGISNLVDPSTGTFSYQIPLFKIGGYPMNLTYQSGIQMEDVASMVGLGWNLNAGCITRNLRGLPDDFNGDKITKEFTMKDNNTFGGTIGADFEIAGLPLPITAGASLGIFYNNYKGWGMEPTLRGSLNTTFIENEYIGGSASLGLGIGVNSQSGVDKYISPSFGFRLGKEGDNLSLSLGKTWSVNSNQGLKTSFNTNLSMVKYNKGTYNYINKEGKKDKKTDQSSMSLFGFSSQSYLNNSFQPDIQYPFENISMNFSGTLGLDAFYVDPNFRMSGYLTTQRLKVKQRDFVAIGTLYEREKIESDNIPSMGDNVIMDFNREKNMAYYCNQSKILPIPYKTPDIFTLSAQGLSFSFSLTKNDNVVVGDAKTEINSVGVQTGIEANLGNLIKIGGNLGVSTSYQLSERWAPFRLSNISFNGNQSIITDNNNSSKIYNNNCFKNNSEINKFTNTLFEVLGGYKPIRFNLIDESIVNLHSLNNINIDELFNKNQPIRQTTISYLTSEEASKIGFDKKIKYYRFSDRNDQTLFIERVSDVRKLHHISEITAIQPDGMKYVFGIPIYNTLQQEVIFNVGSNPVDIENNLVSYVQDLDNSINNRKGIDEYYESTLTPSYATQFLITSVLSSDYKDLTNNGISPDDIGNYVKFNYFKEDFEANQELSRGLYNWRTPFKKDYATYNRGMRSDLNDDKGTYVFGQKELWYIHSIESKTEKAEFYYSKRKDAFGALNQNGGVNPEMFLRKLDSVKIYTLTEELNNNLTQPTIKTIHFLYDYSLCHNSENSISETKGKLTLKQVYFSYENSQKGKLSPYIFEYGITTLNEQPVNPEYNKRNSNRWGYYQENPPNAYSDCDDTKPLSNIDYPYVNQDKEEELKINAYAWNLTNVIIPGGGELTIDYEPNDYSFVQDKTAGQMFKIKGIEKVSSNAFYNEISCGNPSYPDLSSLNNRIYFKRYEEHLYPGFSKEDLKNLYLKDYLNGYIYYKFLINLKSEKNIQCNTIKNNNEYITGYAKIKDYGNEGEYSYIDLEPAALDDEKNNLTCNPILKSALQFMRINRSKLIYSQIDDSQSSAFNPESDPLSAFISFARALPSVITQLRSQLDASFVGINKYCTMLNYCREVDLDKSFIRLYNPIYNKLAGGSRVSKISINDKWDAMTGNTHEGKSYSTNYIYKSEEYDPVTNKIIEISNGVANYEPMIGGDEISLKQPIFYSDIKKKAPDTEYFVESPVNESLYPAPQIIYRKVSQITNKTELNVSKTGKVVNEFFTSKDYPTKVQMTDVEEKRDKTEFNAIQPPFLAMDQQHDFATVSQGFSIELNYMSGLPKATWVFNEKGDIVSGEVNEYFDNNDNFITIDQNGKINYNTKLGLAVDYTIDGKKNYEYSQNNIYQANFNASNIGAVPLPVVMPLFSEMIEERRFQSLVINKIIHRLGILRKKTVYDQSASVSTENIAFDEITGEPLLTKTTNENNDSLYSFKYPAYWIYKEMGPAYENSGLKINQIYSINKYKNFLKKGDELRTLSDIEQIPKRIWFTGIENNTPKFKDEKNQDVPINNGSYILYNTISKNILSDGAGQVVSWNYNPLRYGEVDNDKIAFKDTNKFILNSSAIEFNDSALIFCDSCSRGNCLTTIKNEYLLGLKGNWKPFKTWYYLTERTPQEINGNIEIRKVGLFNQYNDFWTPPENLENWSKNTENWVWKEKVNLQDVEGQTIETEDIIGRKISNLLGYKNSLVIAQAFNSGFGESYYEGFEDLKFNFCTDKLKRVITPQLTINSDDSHTGKYSLSVTAPFEITFKGCRDLYLPSQLSMTNCIECKNSFLPSKNYAFSCWVKVKKEPPILSCEDASVSIKTNGVVLKTLKSEGPVIEGWQRIQGVFLTNSSSAQQISVTLNPGSANTLYDDLRIYSDSGNMVSYVYDDLTLKPTEFLDENNYFTRYEYDKELNLIRVKKETERGIITIKEGTQSLVKRKVNRPEINEQESVQNKKKNN